MTTADGGEASVSLDDDGCGVRVQSLTPELAQILFDVARTRAARDPARRRDAERARSSSDADVPDELEPCLSTAPRTLYEALRRSEELRGARSA